MKKTFYTLFILFSFIYNISAQSNSSRVKIILNELGISQIANLGIDPTEGEYKKHTYLITDLSHNQISKLADADIQYEIIIEDVNSFLLSKSCKRNAIINK